MKQIIRLIFIISVCLSLPCGVIRASAQSFITNGLVAYFPFSGDASDKSGNGNDGTVYGAMLTVDRFGNPNSAYAFDGISSFISMPDSSSLRIPNDITVTCWANFSTNLSKVRLVGKGDNYGRNYGLWLDNSSYWLFQQFAGSSQGGCQENTSSPIPNLITNYWYQIIGVRSGSDSLIYVNGTLVLTKQNHCGDSTYTGSEPLLIGAPPFTDPQFNLMQGSIDDIRIYNRALSSNEVAQLFALESMPVVGLIKLVQPSFSNLYLGTNYQLQVSTDLSTWTNQGSVFTATNSNMIFPSIFNVNNWGSLFFRVQASP